MYTRYTDEQTKRAGEVDLVTLLQQHGQQVRRVGSEYEWYDSDQTVSIKGNLWFGRLQYDVGVGAHSYRPVSIDEIVAWADTAPWQEYREREHHIENWEDDLYATGLCHRRYT